MNAKVTHTPRIIDNDRDEITVTLAGKEIRGWSYKYEVERRAKMLAAREFCEGWFQSAERSADLLAALQMSIPALEWCQKQWANSPQHGEGIDVLSVARAVIAKATGAEG